MAKTADLALDTLLDAMLPHVVFDGWSPASFKAALGDLKVTEAEAKAIAPRGAIDLAVAYHRRADAAMVARMAAADLGDLRYSEKVATALRYRIEAMDNREAVRRASTLFSLPMNAAQGAKLIWETSDAIWTSLGDTSEDANWYTKRATLSGVWASTVLFWLGDDSAGFADTYAFIDRRIEDVMQIEKMKGKLRDNPISKPLMQLQDAFFSKMRAPGAASDDLPGRTSP
ncbi:MAG: COQ9 family protein [Silicimonas sp.]|nr:COQ9 family protein [Silicimonas sp.]